MRGLTRTLVNSMRHVRRVTAARYGEQMFDYKSCSNDQIFSFLKSHNIYYKTRASGQIVVEQCPLCPKPTHGKQDNMWTLNFKPNSGAYLCFRCGSHGAWHDFVRSVIGEEVSTASLANREKEVVPREVFIDFYKSKLFNYDRIKALVAGNTSVAQALPDQRAGAPTSDKGIALSRSVMEYLTGEFPARKFTTETLEKFGVGLGEEMFRDHSNNLALVPCVYFPMVGKEMKRKKEDWMVMKTKIKGIGEHKKHQRIFPSSAPFGLFGLNTLLDTPDKRACVITEGEYDAMSVWQATGIPAVSLPTGASSLPHQLLAYLDGIERVYLRMDFDDVGQFNVEHFAEKIGLSRTYIIKQLSPELVTSLSGELAPDIIIKDANDALRVNPELIKMFIKNATAVPQSNILKFSELRDRVKDRVFNIQKHKGVPSVFFPWFNNTLKDFRRGE